MHTAKDRTDLEKQLKEFRRRGGRIIQVPNPEPDPIPAPQFEAGPRARPTPVIQLTTLHLTRGAVLRGTGR